MVNKLNEKVLYVTIPNKLITEKYGFLLWGEDENEQVCQGKNAVIFIPFSHFELIMDEFQSVFPIENTIFAEYNSFDITGSNIFDKNAIEKIIKNLLNKSVETQDEAVFIKQLTRWLLDQIQTAQSIIVFGNL